MKIEIFVNEEKGRVVAVGRNRRGTFRGIAKCDPEDSFNSSLGEDIALKRMEIAYSDKKIKDLLKKEESLEAQRAFIRKQRNNELCNALNLRRDLYTIIEAAYPEE